MRAAKEIRKWVNRMRSKLGRGNGVVPGYAFDNPEMERKSATSWKRRRLTCGKR